MRIIEGEEQSIHTHLWKTSENEAIDPHNGDKYRIERVEQPSRTGWGLAFGILIGFLIFALLRLSTPVSDPYYNNPAPPASPAQKQ